MITAPIPGAAFVFLTVDKKAPMLEENTGAATEGARETYLLPSS